MRPTDRTLTVLRGEKVAGTLERTGAGCRFRYDPAYLARPDARSVCWSIPTSPEPVEYRGFNLPPFFVNLLPEGVRALTLVARLGIDRLDYFSMLAAVGDDCVGDVWVEAEGRDPNPAIPPFDPSRASFAELHRDLVEEGRAALDVSLSGVQPKLSDALIQLPARLKGGASIVKLSPSAYPRLAENEAFFLALAREAGIEAALGRLVTDREGVAALVVKRLDRVRVRRREFRIHQEDGCQLLDVLPEEKYHQTAQGLLDRIVRLASAPAVETVRFVQLYAFCYLTGNNDFHAKNVSLVEEPGSGLVRLSPAYDLPSTVPYAGLDDAMPLAVFGRDRNLAPRDFVALAARYGVPEAAVTRALRKVRDTVRAAIPRFGGIGLEPAAHSRLCRAVERRLEAFEGL